MDHNEQVDLRGEEAVSTQQEGELRPGTKAEAASVASRPRGGRDRL